MMPRALQRLHESVVGGLHRADSLRGFMADHRVSSFEAVD